MSVSLMQYKHILLVYNVLHGGDSDYTKAKHVRELSPVQVVREESQQLDNVWNGIYSS